MSFSSPLFVFGFLPVFFILYVFSPVKHRNWIIIAASLFFYAWGAHAFVFIVFFSCILDFILGGLIYKTRNTKYYRVLIMIDLMINFGILVYFKYTNFVLDNLNTFFTCLGLNGMTFTRIVLPIGISFVVFQKSTYCLDIAKGAARPAGTFWQYIEYLFVFPQIIAGPIVRYNILAEQISNIENRRITIENLRPGFERFAIGIFKKVWIADVLAKYADIAFNGSVATMPIQYCWFGIICYSFQIYFDFSAYSDMAIGILKITGFTIPENFNHPYISRSITEFWKRWHISLTTWMREYLYIPLGGNRKGAIRTIFNQWIVFFLSGFWHGANWTFICWGIYHGTLLCADKYLFSKITKKIPSVFQLVITFIFILIGWVFFRSNNLSSSLLFIKQLFNVGSYNVHPDPSRIMYVDNRGIFIFIIACIMSFSPLFYKKQAAVVGGGGGKPCCGYLKNTKISLLGCLFLLLISVLKIGTGAISPFIYFEF